VTYDQLKIAESGRPSIDPPGFSSQKYPEATLGAYLIDSNQMQDEHSPRSALCCR